MTPGDTARLLAKLAAFDQRTVGEPDVLAWHEILGHFDLADCLAAVTEHYREESRRAMPVDIRRLAIRIRDNRKGAEERLALAAAPPLPDRSEDVLALVRAVADALPKPDLYERAKARARREHGRPEPAIRQPKPKRAGKPKDYPNPASDDIAAMATRYLIDGHRPADVAERLAVSRRWCEKTADRFRKDAA